MNLKTIRHIFLSLVAVIVYSISFPLSASEAANVCKKLYDDAEYTQAFKHCVSAAENGDANSQTILGEFYDQGLGTEKNPAAAAKWWESASQQGYLPARNLLALKYYYGGDVFGPQQGWSQDYNKAAELWRLDAEKGVATSQFMLGMMYMEGKGFERDNVEAYAWFNMALQKGYKLASDTLIELSALMSSAQKMEGKKRLQALQKQLNLIAN